MKTIQQLGQWLAQFPYENLTKRNASDPRDVSILLEEHEQLGAGGTCFSLVNLATSKAREWGLSPRYYLGDRPDGEARHCVIGFPEQDVFLDPGYLCFDPLPLHPESAQHLVRPHNILHVEPEGPEQLKISTERKGQSTWRHTLHTQPVDRPTFEAAWRESFGWKSVMTSHVLTRVRGEDIVLFLNGRLESITRDQRQRLSPPDGVGDVDFLARLFGINEQLVREWALEIES